MFHSLSLVLLLSPTLCQKCTPAPLHHRQPNNARCNAHSRCIVGGASRLARSRQQIIYRSILLYGHFRGFQKIMAEPTNGQAKWLSTIPGVPMETTLCVDSSSCCMLINNSTWSNIHRISESIICGRIRKGACLFTVQSYNVACPMIDLYYLNEQLHLQLNITRSRNCWSRENHLVKSHI